MNLLSRTLTLAGCAAVFGLGTIVVNAQTPQRTVLSGHLHDAVPALQPMGRLEGSTRLSLSIALPLRNREALENFIQTLYDPENPLYRHYLSPDEFSARFGPTEEDYQAVLAWAAGSGFTVTARHQSRALLEVSAPVADIERALQVRMRTYAHPTETRAFFSPDAEPSVAAGVPILWIGGLDNFARPQPKNLRRAPLKAAANATPQDLGTGPYGGLAGFDFRAPYAPGVTLTGTGQSVGVVEFDGYYASDIVSYESQTGVPEVPLEVVTLDGFDGTPGSANSEVALDIEMAISMAPGLSNVVVFEAGPNGMPNHVLASMATNTLIKQFSCSWSFGPITAAQRTNMDDLFLQLETQGQSFFCASGDSGAATNGIAISPPDDDPYVTLVGGTALGTSGPGATWLSETVWNAGWGPGNGNSSGGISTTYNIPFWQKGVKMNTTNNGSTTKRNAPDVAMVADNILIVADDGLQEVTGGTSTATPLWAAFAALVNQQAAIAGVSNIGFVNPALYHIGTNSGYTACFDDVTVGNNTNNSPTHFLAAPGYDLCTGWGSPTGASLIIALTQPDGFQITPGRGAVANGTAGGPFTVSTQTFTLTNAGKTNFNWSLGTTSDWLDVSSRSGTLAAAGAAVSVTVTLNSAASLLPAGVYTNELWFTNLTSHLVQLRQFTLQVGQDLVLDGGFEAGDFSYWTLSGESSIYTNNYADSGSSTGYSPYEGNYFAALGQPSKLAYLSQPLPTLPNQYYLISIWLQNPSGSIPNQFQIRWNTNATTTNVIFNRTNMGAFGWTNLVFTVKASTNTAKLQFGFRNDYNFFCLDDVSVTPMPPPSFPSSAGGLQVNLGPAGAVTGGAQWEVAGDLNQNSGVTVSNLAAGTYTLSFLPVSGWIPPAPQTVTITNGEITTATGIFTRVNGDPKVSITSPKPGQSVSNGLLLVTGTATDKVTVEGVNYQLNSGGWMPAPPSNSLSNWTASVTLNPGANTISAYAVDNSGTFSSTNTVAFEFIPSATLTVQTNGFGGITPIDNGKLLAIGSNYTLNASPGRNWLFSNWVASGSGNFVSNAPVLRFTMQSNLVLQANFVTNPFPAIRGTYNGLFFQTNPASAPMEQSSGLATITITSTSKGAYSAELKVDGGSYSFSGIFDLYGNSVTNIPRRGKTPLALILHIDLNLNPLADSMTGSVEASDWPGPSVLAANLDYFNGTTLKATNYAGKYTFVLPGSETPATSPGGYSAGEFTNNLAGTAILTGTLADNTTITSLSTPISKEGFVPIYYSYGPGTNVIFGWLQFTNEPPQTVLGELTWLKLPTMSKVLYSNGFALQSNIIGSLHSPATTNTLVTNGMLTIADPGQGINLVYTNVSVISNKLTYATTTTNELTATITPGTGAISLSFRPTGAKANLTAKGAMLQDSPADPAIKAAGWFGGTNQTGYFILTH